MSGITEQTLVLIKPDALKNSLTGYVLSYLSEYHTGLRFAATNIVHVTRMLATEHYAEHAGKTFFPPLLDYIMGIIHYPDAPEQRRVIAIVYRGIDAVKKVRNIAGPTNPHVARETNPGCIRALGTSVQQINAAGAVVGERMDNLIHASANQEDAEREIKLWFKPHDIPTPMHPYQTAICEEHFYYKKNTLSTTYEKGSVCILAPGNTSWQTDLDALRLLSEGKAAPQTLSSIVAKYLINGDNENM